MQDVISPRKLKMCRRSPELGRSTFERKILVEFMVQCKWGISCNQKLYYIYWSPDCTGKIQAANYRRAGNVRTKTG